MDLFHFQSATTAIGSAIGSIHYIVNLYIGPQPTPISWLCNLSGPMVWHYCHGISISTHPYSSFYERKRQFHKKHYIQAKDVWRWIFYGNYVGLLSQKFPLASAKAQPRGDFYKYQLIHLVPVTKYFYMVFLYQFFNIMKRPSYLDYVSVKYNPCN